MLRKGVGTIVFLIITFIAVGAIDHGYDSDDEFSNDDFNEEGATERYEKHIAVKDIHIVLDQSSWNEAVKHCRKLGMQVVHLSSKKQQNNFFHKIKFVKDDLFWVSQTYEAKQGKSIWTDTKNLPRAIEQHPIGHCVSWLWMNKEICVALRPKSNEWFLECCDEKKPFACEYVLYLIQRSFIEVLDNKMLREMARVIPTSTDKQLTLIVSSALSNFIETHLRRKQDSTFLLAKAIELALKISKLDVESLPFTEIQQYAEYQISAMDSMERIELYNERISMYVGEEYLKLLQSSKIELDQWQNPSEQTIQLIVTNIKKFLIERESEYFKNAPNMQSKQVPPTTDIIDDERLNSISGKLVEFSETEFSHYILDLMTKLEQINVFQIDMAMTNHLFYLLRDELFLIVDKAMAHSTHQERIVITKRGLEKILKGKNLVEEDSQYSKIFVYLAFGTSFLKSIRYAALGDSSLRTYVKHELMGVTPEQILNLKEEGYTKFIMGEVIKIAARSTSYKKKWGKLFYDRFVTTIADQFLYSAVARMNLMGKRLAKSIKHESDELQEIVNRTKMRLAYYDQHQVDKMALLIEQDFFAHTVKTIAKYSEEEMYLIAETALSRIVAENFHELKEKKKVVTSVLISLESRVLKSTEDEFALLTNEELGNLVRSELGKIDFTANKELMGDLCINLIEREFVKLVQRREVTITPNENETLFQKTIKLLAASVSEAGL
ncbi:hypothetical protein Bhyg_16261 [Pseudolycoriella hygida]|uniref:C-type lectin domain-containing protein n=1 Tax=Pseudolycoriella hygida TaxID=35572 RepID=A0A9Q0MM58_9DIPT|nr:hypothetical protein Bhyg_16261 [Pseudolycoriella hygida]